MWRLEDVLDSLSFCNDAIFAVKRDVIGNRECMSRLSDYCSPVDGDIP